MFQTPIGKENYLTYWLVIFRCWLQRFQRKDKNHDRLSVILNIVFITQIAKNFPFNVSKPEILDISGNGHSMDFTILKIFLWYSKKVLLRDRKRRTACGVGSLALVWGRYPLSCPVGYFCPVWGWGYPYPVLGIPPVLSSLGTPQQDLEQDHWQE